MRKIKVQYIIGFNIKDPFCKSQIAFLNLFSTLDDTTIESNTKIKFKDVIIIYKIKTINKVDEKIKYYDLTLSISDVINIEKFVKFLSSVRSLLMNITSSAIETVWDDVGLFYSQKSYPLIHETENLMRMLITKFMIIKVGLQWTKQNVPDEVKKSIRTDTKMNESNYLYELDFIQLSNLLFQKYTDKNISGIYEVIEGSDEALKKESLMPYIPKSNWYRYFSEIVDCDDNYIIKRWKRLYDLRCKIAHNKPINKSDHDEVLRLTTEIKEILNKALEKLSEISITEEEKEEISVNFAKSKSTDIGEFFNIYEIVKKNMINLPQNTYVNKDDIVVRNIPVVAKHKDRIDNAIPHWLIDKMYEMSDFRNNLVNSYNIKIDSNEIIEKIMESRKIADEVLKISPEEGKMNYNQALDNDDIEDKCDEENE